MLLMVNFSIPIIILPINIKTGESALIKEAKLLVKFFSATVVKPFAPIKSNDDKVN